MKRLTWRDGLVAAVFAAVLVPYVGYVIRGDMPFIKDARGMAVLAIVGVVAAFAIWGLRLQSSFGKAAMAGGLVTLALGALAALIGSEGNDTLLAVFIVAAVLLWAAETVFDVGLFHRH